MWLLQLLKFLNYVARYLLMKGEKERAEQILVQLLGDADAASRASEEVVQFSTVCTIVLSVIPFISDTSWAWELSGRMHLDGSTVPIHTPSSGGLQVTVCPFCVEP